MKGRQEGRTHSVCSNFTDIIKTEVFAAIIYFSRPFAFPWTPCVGGNVDRFGVGCVVCARSERLAGRCVDWEECDCVSRLTTTVRSFPMI